MGVGTLLVRHDPASAAVVRQRVAEDLIDAAVTRNSVDDVVLVISELVGNAVTHSVASDLDIAWQIDGQSVVVRVHDASPALPRMKRVTPSATSGRGLAIVDAIALEWGTRPTATGKQVWARIPVTFRV